MAKKKGKKIIEVNPGVQVAGQWNVATESGPNYLINADASGVLSNVLSFLNGNVRAVLVI